MALLNRGNTCITHVYDPTPINLHITTGRLPGIMNIQVLSEYLKFRGFLTALYICQQYNNWAH